MFRRLPFLFVFLLALLTLGVTSANAQEGRGKKAQLLLIPVDNIPPAAEDALREVLRKRGELLSTSAYVRACRARRLKPSSVAALRRVGSRGNVDVFVLAGFLSVEDRTFRVVFRDGETTARLRVLDFQLKSVSQVPRPVQDNIGRELDETLAEVRGTPAPKAGKKPRVTIVGEDGEPRSEEESEEGEEKAEGEEATKSSEEEESASKDEDEDEEEENKGQGSGFAASLSAGLGIGTRGVTVPTPTGFGTLKTNPFAAFHVGLFMGYRTASERRSSYGLEARFYTSAGLKLQDQRDDGTTRTVDSRSQHVSAGFAARFNLLKRERSPYMILGLGYGMRLFSSEAPLTVPGYILSGPYLRPGFYFPLGSGPISLGVVPEIYVITYLTNLEASGGFMAGGELHLRYDIVRAFQIGIIYRESHARVNTNTPDKVKDAERFIVLQASYIF